jgi:hypothetical protein
MITVLGTSVSNGSATSILMIGKSNKRVGLLMSYVGPRIILNCVQCYCRWTWALWLLKRLIVACTTLIHTMKTALGYFCSKRIGHFAIHILLVIWWVLYKQQEPDAVSKVYCIAKRCMLEQMLCNIDNNNILFMFPIQSSINLTNSVALVRERTIPTQRLPLVGEDSADICE